MSLPLPTRRLFQTARSSVTARPSTYLNHLPQTQRRNAGIMSRIFGRKRKSAEETLQDDIKQKEADAAKLYEKMTNRTGGETMFDEEIKEVEKEKSTAADGEKKKKNAMAEAFSTSRAKEHMARALDPDPRWRIRWQRRKVMQMVRNTGKPLTKEQKIQLVEKDYHFKSENLPTSVKKLVKLAHQVAGKTVDDALLQMHYSKKKMGIELEHYLKEARDRAIVNRGMGLGKVNGEGLDEPRKIQTKDGKWINVDDPTRLYIDQAWVGKGPWRGMRVQYHARGRSSAMWKPSTHIAFVLKEEKTRLRKYDEKLEKKAKQKPWVHLPNRPVTAQRQYYSW